jgi:single-stranded-DNA-specific exonuclease
LPAFRAYLEETLAASVAQARRESALLIDGALSAAAATPDFVTSLEGAGPFGAGNPEPVFVFPSHTVAFAEPVGAGHVRLRLKSGDGTFLPGIAFRAGDQLLGRMLIEHRGRPLHVAGSLAIDRWQGGERVQLRVSDVAIPTSGRL